MCVCACDRQITSYFNEVIDLLYDMQLGFKIYIHLCVYIYIHTFLSGFKNYIQINITYHTCMRKKN